MDWQHAPLDPAFGHIQDGREHGSPPQGPRAATACGGGAHLCDPLPFLGGQVAGIWFCIPRPILHNPRRLFRQALKAAACVPETPALPRRDDHHDLVRHGVELIAAEEKSVGGQLGRPSGARFRTYERLKGYSDIITDTLFDSQQLRRAIEDIYNYPLRQAAVDILNRQLRSGISDEALAQLVI